MFALVLTMALGAGDPAAKASPADQIMMDGNWTVVCIEKNGVPVADAKDKSVMFKGNMVSFTGAEAKSQKSMKVEFGSQGKIRVTEIDPNVATDDKTDDDKTGKGAKTGTYILTKDFLAICLHDETTQASEVKPASGTETSFQSGQPQAKSVCTMVLKRSDSGTIEPRR
ncbi:hypothetical protein [Zavarzinella formosa]|uniref:hypothetical protein n=1 Tax=Zavarzinella formosa TaxID=360055 RepID=UPI0003170104|nr:hypothetical protein [Zavarzinella formosa]